MSEEEKEYNIVLPELNSQDKKQCTETRWVGIKQGVCSHDDRTNILKAGLGKIEDELRINKEVNIDDIIPECISLALITVTFHSKEGGNIEISISSTDIHKFFKENKDKVANVGIVKLKAKISKIKPSREEIDRIPAKLKNVESCIILRSLPQKTKSGANQFRILNGDSVEWTSWTDNKIYKFDTKTGSVSDVSDVPPIVSIQDQLTEGVVYYVTCMGIPRKIIDASSKSNGSFIDITYLDDNAIQRTFTILKQREIPLRKYTENVDTIKFISRRPYVMKGQTKNLLSTRDLGNDDNHIVNYWLKNSYVDVDVWNFYTNENQSGGKIIHKSKKMRTIKKHYKKSNSSSKRRRHHRNKRVSQRR